MVGHGLAWLDCLAQYHARAIYKTCATNRRATQMGKPGEDIFIGQVHLSTGDVGDVAANVDLTS